MTGGGRETPHLREAFEAMKSGNRLSLIGLAATVVGGVSYFLLLDVPFIRNTAIPNLVLVVAGMGMAGYAVFKKRSWVTIPSGAVSAFVGLGLILSLFVLMKLPAVGQVASAADVLPDFTLPNQDGQPVTLSSFRGKGPVLLVFYRGHW